MLTIALLALLLPMADGDDQAVRKAEADLERAMRAKDADSLKKILHPGFVSAGVRGDRPRRTTRDEWLDVNLNRLSIKQYSTAVTQVDVYGSTAVATVEGSWLIGISGRDVSEKFLLTDVWVKDGGAWKVARRHSAPYQSRGPEAEAEVRRALEAFSAAWKQGDIAALELLVADDYIHTDIRGTLHNRADWMAGAKSRAGSGSTIETGDVAVRLYGDTAVVTGINTFTDRPGATRLRFTQVWRRNGGRWQRAAFQGTLPEGDARPPAQKN